MATSLLWTAATIFLAAVDGFSQPDIEQFHARYSTAQCVVQYSVEITDAESGELNRRDSSAPGLIVSSKGLIMAPGHMALENAEPFNIRVIVNRGERDEMDYEAKLLPKPDDVNICFLQLQSEKSLNLPHIQFQSDVPLRLGESIMVLGVLGENLDYAPAFLIRRVGAIIEKPRQTYCIDEPVPLGFVSGPVINTEGQAIGIVGFDLSPAEGGDLYVRSGHPLVYQTNLFAKYITKPPTKADVGVREEEAWLGVLTQPLKDDLAEYWSLPKNGGIVISTIVAGSPAETAGLQRGDVITEFNGVPLRIRQDREIIRFTKLVRDAGIGHAVPLKVLRNGQVMEFKVTTAGRPKTARDASEFTDDALGLTVREITADVRMLLNLSPDVQGVIVYRVKSGSPADLAGIRRGVILMSLNEQPVGSINDYEKAVSEMSRQKPKEVTVFCRIRTATGFFRLEPRWEQNEAK